jgi:hypothetical protein
VTVHLVDTSAWIEWLRDTCRRPAAWSTNYVRTLVHQDRDFDVLAAVAADVTCIRELI